MHPPSVHQHADRVGERGGQVSQAGNGASGSGLHGNALGAVGESATGAHQQLVSTMQGAVGKAGGALQNQSGLLKQTAQRTSDTDGEHAGALNKIRPEGDTPSTHPTGKVGGAPDRGYNVINVSPGRSSRRSGYSSGRYRTDSSGRRTRFDVYPSSSSSRRYRIDSSGRRTRFDVHPAPRPPRVSASQRPYPGYLSPPPGSMVSSATFRRPDGSFDYASEGEFMRRNYPNVRHVNPGYHRNEPGTHDNCGPASLTTNRVNMTGRRRQAPTSGVTDQYTMEAAENSRFRPVTHYGEIPDRIRTDPHGRNYGTLFTSESPRRVGHYISVHRDDRGRTVFIDGQSNRVGHLDPNAGVMDYMPANEPDAPEWRRPY
ncbi:MAG TPA: hypothetical protein VGN81_12295 [Pseudonocardiaceae bacterium]|jgi:hypothetical protein